MENTRRIGGGVFVGWQWLVMVLGLATSMSLTIPAQAQEPVNCDGISIELADQFASPICYMTRFRGGDVIGRTQSIQGESRDYMIHFQSSRSGAGSTYLYALDFDKLMDFYGMSAGQKALGPEREAGDGFSYVSVGGNGLDACILFLKQTRPIRNGYRAQYYGLACDKGREGEFAPEDAAALLDLVKGY